MSKEKDLPNLLSVKKFCEKHTSFKNGGIRNLIFNSQSNGMKQAGVLLKIGKNVYINERKFFDWIDKMNGL
jgi:hypothetical protein